MKDSFQTLKTLTTKSGTYGYYDLQELERKGLAEVSRLPFSIRVMLESLLRHEDGYQVTREDIEALARWQPDPGEINVPLKLARVILQDFTGVPAVVDLAAMRDAVAKRGGDPRRINPVVPADLVIDHSVQVDASAPPTPSSTTWRRSTRGTRSATSSSSGASRPWRTSGWCPRARASSTR